MDYFNLTCLRIRVYNDCPSNRDASTSPALSSHSRLQQLSLPEMDFLSCALLLLLACTTILVLRSFLATTRKPNYKIPPGPSPLPIIGNLLELGNKPHQSLAKLAKIHGPIMSLKLGQNNHCCHPFSRDGQRSASNT